MQPLSAMSRRANNLTLDKHLPKFDHNLESWWRSMDFRRRTDSFVVHRRSRFAVSSQVHRVLFLDHPSELAKVFHCANRT